MDIVAIKYQVGVHILQTTPQARRTVYGFSFQFSFGVDGGVEDKRFFQTDYDCAG